ncbi:unnamed protein product [Calypogeia fissa]
MQWSVDRDSAITEDQLLSTKDKTNVIQSVQSDVNVLRQGMQAAVNLKIYPPELINESKIRLERREVATLPTNGMTDKLSTEESVVALNGMEEGTPLISATRNSPESSEGSGRQGG